MRERATERERTCERQQNDCFFLSLSFHHSSIEQLLNGITIIRNTNFSLKIVGCMVVHHTFLYLSLFSSAFHFPRLRFVCVCRFRSQLNFVICAVAFGIALIWFRHRYNIFSSFCNFWLLYSNLNPTHTRTHTQHNMFTHKEWISENIGNCLHFQSIDLAIYLSIFPQNTIGYVDTVPLWYNHKKYGSNIQNKIELAAGNSGQLEQCEWNRTNKIDSMNNLVKDSFNFIGKIQRIFRIFSTSLFLWIWTDWSIVGQICYMWCALCIPHVNGINQLNLLFCSNDWWSIGVSTMGKCDVGKDNG